MSNTPFNITWQMVAVAYVTIVVGAIAGVIGGLVVSALVVGVR